MVVASNILQFDLNQCDEVVRDVATLPLLMGGLGLRSAVRVRSPAYWASWADCLPMMQARHPRVVAEILAELGDRSASPCLEEARRAAWDLFGVMGFEPPSWHAVVNGARPPHDGNRNQEASNKVNMKRRRGWDVNISRSICSQDSPRQADLWFDRKPVQAVGWPCPRVQRAASRHWILTSSVCSCFVVSNCLFL